MFLELTLAFIEDSTIGIRDERRMGTVTPNVLDNLKIWAKCVEIWGTIWHKECTDSGKKLVSPKSRWSHMLMDQPMHT